MIRPLVWAKGTRYKIKYKADVLFGKNYIIWEKDDGRYIVSFGETWEDEHIVYAKTIKEAKAIAQSHWGDQLSEYLF